MNHDHDFVRDRVALYLTGDLSKEEMSKVEAHLVECPDCAEEFDATARTVAAVTAYGSAEAPTSAVSRNRWNLIGRAAAAAIIFAAGIGVGRASIGSGTPMAESIEKTPGPTVFAAPAEAPKVATSAPIIAGKSIDQYAASDSPFAASLRALAAFRRP